MSSNYTSQANAATFVSFQAELARHKQSYLQSRSVTQSNVNDDNSVSLQDGSFVVRKAKHPIGNSTSNTSTISQSNSKRQSGNETKGENVSSEPNWEQCKDSLTRKAKLYDELCENQRCQSYNVNSSDEEDEIEGNGIHLVDFTKKTHEARIRKAIKTAKGSNSLVEYIDAFGRTRSCRPEELSRILKEQEQLSNDIHNTRECHDASESEKRDLMSRDMEREEERKKWENGAHKEVASFSRDSNEEGYKAKKAVPVELPGPGPVYFEHLRKGEIRQYGISYYRLSTDDETREKQLQQLQQLHELTEENRKKNEIIREKRRTQMQDRLDKIKKRRGLPTEEAPPATDEQNNGIVGELESIRQVCDEETALQNVNISTALPATHIHDLPDSAWHHKVREWDRGKTMSPVNQKKSSYSSYIHARREERNPDFAPPKFL